MSRPPRPERGRVYRPEGQAPWIAREPHFLLIAADLSDAEPAPREFSAMVPGVGCVTVVPGQDADFAAILVELRLLQPRRYRHRVLYHEDREVERVGAYPDGARLQWGRR